MGPPSKHPAARRGWNFNPSVGILWGGTPPPPPPGASSSHFNPSVGILWGGTLPACRRSARPAQFQSLGRDSVGWDCASADSSPPPNVISIPRSGFCGVGPTHRFVRRRMISDFNPSVGILWGGTNKIQTKYTNIVSISIPRSGFCGVGLLFPEAIPPIWDISIPRSGFCGVGLNRRCKRVINPPISIPRSGFCGVGPPPDYVFDDLRKNFNPSVGILWGGTLGRQSFVSS